MALTAAIYQIQGLGFEVVVREHHTFMDAKKEMGSKDRGPNPKEYVLAGLCGCTGMDVASLMKKFKAEFKTFEVTANAELTKEHPIVFSDIKLEFKFTGDSIDHELAKKSVDLSMTKYCGVSAMLSKTAPIKYDLFINDQVIAQGEASFTN